MKMRWAAALLVLTGLGTASARANGFGFTLANATVVNNDANHNGKADLNETFTITNAPFASYRSTVDSLVLNDKDLSRYSATISGKVIDVVGTTVRYDCTFSVVYSGPALTTTIETGTMDLRANFGTGTAAFISGTVTANPGVESADDPFKSNGTDFAPYNPGRFFGTYEQDPGGATGNISASVNAGSIGFAANMSNATVVNGDETRNGHADLGETFTMDAPLESYVALGAPPLTNNDLNLYHLIFNGKVTGINGQKVTYLGTFQLVFKEPVGFPTGLVIETGTFALTADYNEATTGGAKLSAQLYAKSGYETSVKPWEETDYAIFNPGTFTGTYVPTSPGATSGIASGSLFGGVVGFTAAFADANVANTDENGNGHADLNETFNAGGPLAAYTGVGAPVLLDRDLGRYNLTMNGKVTAIAPDNLTVTYDGTFRITYANPTVSAIVETGTFHVVAIYNHQNQAYLSGTLRAKAGAEDARQPFNTTDWSPFNDAAFTGFYQGDAPGSPTGKMRGSFKGGVLTQTIVSRRMGAAIEGSPTAATRSDDARLALVASGSRFYVLDPATGNDIPGFEGGKALDGKVLGRPASLDTVDTDDAYVATDAGTLYRFNLRTGAVTSGQPLGAGAKIYTAPAVVDHRSSGLAQDYVVLAGTLPTNASVVAVVSTANLGTAVVSQSIGSAITVSSPSVPYANRVVVGSMAGLYTFSFPDLTPISNSGLVTPTSPLVVGASAYVGTGDGSTLTRVNVATGASSTVGGLGSPLLLGAFYEKRTNLIQAGTIDGRVVSFDPAGNKLGLTLPGLFNANNTGGSYSSPVETNNVLYRGTESLEILSGVALNGDDQRVISVGSPVRGAMAATGQDPLKDFILGTSQDGLLHMITVR